MSYETGTTVSHTELLTKLYARLGTDDWTQIRANGGPASDQRLVSDPGATETNVFAFAPLGTGATASWKCQPGVSDAGGGVGVDVWDHTGSPDASGGDATYVKFGQPNGVATQGFDGASIAYHFFTGTNADGSRYCHVVLEGELGRFWHLSFGTILKAGTLSGGQYMTASSTGSDGQNFNWAFDNIFNSGDDTGCQWIRDDDNFNASQFTTDGGTSGWFRNMALAGTRSSNQNMFLSLFAGGQQNWNQRTPLCPIWAQTFNTNTVPNYSSTQFIFLGQIPDIRFVSMNGRQDGEEIVIGSDTWHFFPMHRKATNASDDSDSYDSKFTAGSAPNYVSNLMGLAYRENP